MTNRLVLAFALAFGAFAQSAEYHYPANWPGPVRVALSAGGVQDNEVAPMNFSITAKLTPAQAQQLIKLARVYSLQEEKRAGVLRRFWSWIVGTGR